ncbi:MAG: hypothetical protein IJL37_10540 [Bacteroidaceae bacterium]|nr:hypothetical protein [Bacteroidaceae bacterium]
MTEGLELNEMLKKLVKLIDNTVSNLDLCNDNNTIPHFTDGLVNEIHLCTERIKQLNEEVGKGNITLEMARIDIDHWLDEKTWYNAKKLYKDCNFPEGLAAHERLREALKLMQENFGKLNYNLLDAPKECYARFFKLCHSKAGAEKARRDFKEFKSEYLYKDDLLRSYQHYLQKIIYILYERDFLRYDQCPLEKPHGHKFKFQFDLISSEAKESPETIRFCISVNHYLIMPDKYTVYLDTEKLGKYLLSNYLNLSDYDKFSISYLEEALNLYNPNMKEVLCQIAEQNDEKEMNILKQPAAMVLWEKLQKARYIDQSLQPMPNMSNTQLAIIADEFCAKLGIKAKWTYFEKLWNKKNMRGYNSRSLDQENSFLFREEIRQILG